MSLRSIVSYLQSRSRFWVSLTFLVAIAALVVSCGTPQRKPTIQVEPESVRPGNLVAVIGSQWQPNDVISVNLVSVYEGEPISDTVAIARTEQDEHFVISFFYPSDERWTQVDSVTVTARAAGSALETSATLSVTMPLVAADAKHSLLFPLVTTGALSPTSGLAVKAVQSPAPIAQVIAERVNLRAGPSTAYPVLTVVSQGTPFSVLGQNGAGDWLRIRLNSGLEGWMARMYTTFEATVPVIWTDALPIAGASREGVIWRGEYYGNRDLSGLPAIVRGDQSVKFDWAFAAPSAILPPDNFSVRWTRGIYFPAGAYRFTVTVDDGMRLWIGNQLVIDEWREGALRTVSVEQTFQAADTRLIQIEYFEATERAQIDFWWERISEFPEWRAAYFDNRTLAGTPVLLRNESDVNFSWGQGSPAAAVPADGFSARWTRAIEFDQDIYRFHALMDDGLRLFIDGNLVIDEWREIGQREVVVDYALNRGFHAMRIDYYENAGDAVARVWWEKAGSTVAYPEWKGEYWPNTDLSGSPALVRNDAVLNFNWGISSPGAVVPTDNFSARWTRSLQFGSGTYRFHANVDDGVRIWIDDRLVVDEWQDGSLRDIAVDHALAEGMHTLRVEFFERSGDAMIAVWWERVNQQSTFPDWKGEYWPNQGLSGDPTVVRNDRAIDFAWDVGAAAPGLPDDRFSARWTRRVNFEPGLYRFYARADDGIRVWVDNNRIIDHWQDNPGWEVYQADLRLDGQQPIKVEYFDHTGNALAEVWWRKLPDEPKPAATRTPEPSPTPTETLEPAPTETPEPAPTETPVPQASAVRNAETGDVEVNGSGLDRGRNVRVYLAMPDGARTPEHYAAADADDAGQVKLAFAMPTSWPDGTPISAGPVTLVIVTDDGTVELTAQFDYIP